MTIAAIAQKQTVSQKPKFINDGLSSSVIIRNSTGREFKTSQNIVLTTVLQTVQNVLDEKMGEM